MDARCFSRNVGPITSSQQHRLGQARVAVFGLGGVGGICAELIVRAGIGRLMVVDFDCFEPTNFNRQLLATRKTIGKSKTSVFAARARTINPKMEIRKINKKLEYASLAIFERELAALHPGIVIDTMDNIGSRVLLARLCKKMRVPYVYAAATDARGMASIVQGAADLERLLRLPSAGKPDAQVESFLIHYPQCRSAWGPGTNLAGVLAANAALNYLLKKPYPRAPDFWMADSFRRDIVRMQRLA